MSGEMLEFRNSQKRKGTFFFKETKKENKTNELKYKEFFV